MSAYPLRTERLVLRLMGSGDVVAHAAYRSDPAVAAHQDWELPYDPERSAYLTEQDDRDDILRGGWTTLAVELHGEVIGDVCTRLHETGGVAEIGYTLARAHWGKGYGSEAALALVEDLVTRIGVQRVYAELDPVNVASQRVLETIGLVFESHTYSSYLWRGEWSDNMSYAATAEQWLAWRGRPTGPPAEVALAPITADTVLNWFALAPHHSQQRFVAPMPQSFAQALYPPQERGHQLVPRLHGVTADGEPAGFCMWLEPTPDSPPYLWRFLVDRRHQGRGIGQRALVELVDLLTREGHRSLRLGAVEGPGSPLGFYQRFGFRATGEVEDGETIAQLDW